MVDHWLFEPFSVMNHNDIDNDIHCYRCILWIYEFHSSIPPWFLPMISQLSRLREFVKRFVRHVVSSSAGGATFKALLQLFLDQTLDDRLKDNIRFAIMEKYLGEEFASFDLVLHQSTTWWRLVVVVANDGYNGGLLIMIVIDSNGLMASDGYDG